MQLRERRTRTFCNLCGQPGIKKRKYQIKNFSSIINAINNCISKQLKHTASPLRQFKVDVSNSFTEYLDTVHGIKKIYSASVNFLDLFEIVKSNKIDSNNRYFIDPTTFRIKINKRRNNFIRGEGTIHTYTENPSITIKFTKRRENKFDQSALEILDRFENK